MKLSVKSTGAVTPAGFGHAAITAPWPATATASAAGVPVQAGLIAKEHPDLVRWQKEPRLRRASPITYYMVEAVSQALQSAPPGDRARIGVVAAFFLGCLVYSVRFYRQITDEGRRFASPVLFPETVFNSPLSHAVATLGLGGPVYSQIGDKTCWASALRTAQCWLANGDCDQVIVLAAEEFEPHEVDALHAGGLLRGGLQPCEGAVAMLVEPADGPAIDTVMDGYGFRDKRGAIVAAGRCLAGFPPQAPLLRTATGWTRATAETTGRDLAGAQRDASDGFTLSAAADTLRALELVASGRVPEVIVPVWGLTRQFAAYRVSA
ncbi:MAG: beta-ketoacyl synthase N-terminal-like domain-containing protein [Chthoniobacterales bacterium]|jgi:hypothetical protein